MLDAATQAAIREHWQAVDALYRAAKKRSKGDRCDICGAGDTLGKNAVLYRVRTKVHGYEHRAQDSPHLCHRHASGWALSHTAFNPLNTRTMGEVDLHFAAFLAKQLAKSAGVAEAA